ncbi:16S rRNA (guanine1516-N2)-methyltransferase [Crenobacter luteus]|uniref:class I SAM-dependent methyltransferase n=1 Tax=Crenobacter luteus TaxID=1452487 RepID=UPI001044F083|nr:class I SAM-dependent methyltransferase [Crenobacter luteus]TCP13583.1 16S rRNA (guanine1516-N2)-methyltransferase [Crenobacter luteus]
MAFPLFLSDPERRERAEELARRYGLHVVAAPPATGYWLELTAARLELAAAAGHGAVFADFVDGAARHRREFGGGRGQPVARAVGLKGAATPSVVDATAGLGRDAFVLASLGCAVTLIERSPVAAALLDDALERASRDDTTAPIAARMTLVHADAAEWLSTLAEDARPDVVYLDPMFPDTGKSAAAKKDMQAFQSVIGDDLDADRLLVAAVAAAKKRVVVKRPRLGAPLAGVARSGELPGKSTRFDLYAPRPVPLAGPGG